MNNNERQAISVLASTIKEATKVIVDKANYDTTVTGVITQIIGKTYYVKINGEEYRIKSSVPGLKKGQSVRINIPSNNWNDMYIANTVTEHTINTSEINDFEVISNLEIDKLFK